MKVEVYYKKEVDLENTTFFNIKDLEICGKYLRIIEDDKREEDYGIETAKIIPLDVIEEYKVSSF